MISKYLYFAEERLIQACKDCEYRYVRRDLDSIDLLEEIIARERLEAFKAFKFDIVNLLKLNSSQFETSTHLKIGEPEHNNANLAALRELIG